MTTKLNHIAVAVHSIEQSLSVYQDALGLTASALEEVPDQQVRIAFLPVGDSEIELIEPTAADTGVSRFLEKRGEGLHHICLEVEDLEATLASLKSSGVALIDETPRVGGQGSRIAFIHPRSMNGVLVELTEIPDQD